VLAIAFAASYLSAALLDSKVRILDSLDPFRVVAYSGAGTATPHGLPMIVMALLATGGSAFWSSLLGYTSALKSTQQVTNASTSLAYRAKSEALGVSVTGSGVSDRPQSPTIPARVSTTLVSLANNRPVAPTAAPAALVNSKLQSLSTNRPPSPE
jgi:hypothetical protein